MRIKFVTHIIEKIYVYWSLRNSDLFDKEWYVSEYPICKTSILSPYWYYVWFGYKLGHNPSRKFSGKLYWYNLHIYDWKKRCPLIHYMLYNKDQDIALFHVRNIPQASLTAKDFNEIRSVKKNQKKVLLISHEASLTGAPRALLNLAICLKKFGVHVVVWSMKDGLLGNEIINNNIAYKVPLFCFFLEKMNSREMNDTLSYISEFNIVLFNTIVTFPFVEKIKDTITKKIGWIHEGKISFETLSVTKLFPIYADMFDEILVVGDYSKSIVDSFTAKKIKLQNFLYGLPDFITSNDIAPVWIYKNNKLKLLMIGTIEPRKGHLILLDSLRLLPEYIRDNIDILIVGKIVKERIFEKIRKSGFQCIHIVEQVNHKRLLSYIKGMDILLCPSIDDPMPIVCTEAMMFSKPVIVGSNTGTASFIRDGVNGYIVESGNSVSLANAITSAYVARANLREMGGKARKIYEDFFTMKKFENYVKKIFNL